MKLVHRIAGWSLTELLGVIAGALAQVKGFPAEVRRRQPGPALTCCF